MGDVPARRPSPAAEDLDEVWHALASGWRRQILDLLRRRTCTTAELWVALGPAKLSRFAVMQHLGVLQRAGLVLRRRRGRTTYNVLDPAPLQQICRQWLSVFRGLPRPRHS